MNRELTDLGSARVQTTELIRFRVEAEDENGNVIELIGLAYLSTVG